MSGSRRSSLSRSGDGDRTGSNENDDRRRNQVSRQLRLRANNHRNRLHRLAVTHVMNSRAGSAGRNAASTVPTYSSSSSSRAGCSTPSNNFSNLESFVYSVTPVVPAHISSEASTSKEAGIRPYFRLGDLWRTFEEWSTYGAGVPFLLNGRHQITQYYVPYLSGMQVYIDLKKPPTTTRGLAEEKDDKSHEPDQKTDLGLDGSSASLNLNNEKLKQGESSDNKTEVCGSRGELAFQFIEQEGPYTRKPLSAQASILESRFPELSNYRSCNLLPSSWICVAWYPIYRIPVGPTLEELEACFLTLHPLSTQPGSQSQSVNSANGLPPLVFLPAIGLLSYKLKGSMISPRDPNERKKEHSLLMTAGKWLNNLRTFFPDYHFFINRYSS